MMFVSQLMNLNIIIAINQALKIPAVRCTLVLNTNRMLFNILSNILFTLFFVTIKIICKNFIVIWIFFKYGIKI